MFSGDKDTCIMGTQRKELVWNIKKGLFKLSSTDIYQVAKDIAASNNDKIQLDQSDEEGCLDYVFSYMQSDALLQLEDDGISLLLMLNDLVSKLVCADRGVSVGVPVEMLTDVTHTTPSPTSPAVIGKHISQQHPHSDTHAHTTTQSVGELRKVYEELGEQLKRCEAVTGSPATAFTYQSESTPHQMPQMASERLPPLRDFPYFQRREFRVHGGQIGDQGSEMGYNNIVKQIDEGVSEGFTEAEIVRGMLRVIKPGTFKDMLLNKDEITIPELKGFLRSHLGEKANTELFQELMCAKQTEQEAPQQFMYRMIGLKQKLLFQSKQAKGDISYDPKTIQEVFLHTIYQGLGTKHTELRQRMRPLISNSQITDEEILSEVMKIVNEENEHQRRLGQTPRQKSTHVYSTKVETGNEHSNDKPRAAAAADNSQIIQQLSAQVENLTKMMASLMEQQVTNFHKPQTQSHYQSRSPSQPNFPKRGRTTRCPKCTEQNLQECSHCFVCGETGHRAVGCLRQTRFQGNGIRSLSRDSQRPVFSPSPSQE